MPKITPAYSWNFKLINYNLDFDGNKMCKANCGKVMTQSWLSKQYLDFGDIFSLSSISRQLLCFITEFDSKIIQPAVSPASHGAVQRAALQIDTTRQHRQMRKEASTLAFTLMRSLHGCSTPPYVK